MKRLLLALAVAAGLFPATRGAAQQRDSLAATVERLSAEVETLKGRRPDPVAPPAHLRLSATGLRMERRRIDLLRQTRPRGLPGRHFAQDRLPAATRIRIAQDRRHLPALQTAGSPQRAGRTIQGSVLDREHALRAAQIRIHRIFDGGLPPDGVHRRLRRQRHGTRPGRTALRRIDRPRRIQHPQLQRRRIQRRRDQHQGQEQEQGRRGAADGSTPARTLLRGILLLGRGGSRLRPTHALRRRRMLRRRTLDRPPAG